MWSASNTFKEKAVDGFSPQNVVMVFNDLFFSANDGDFAESGITWNGYFNTAEDLTYGEAPSDTESFSLINDNGVLASFEYGVEQTYFGVQTDSESFSLPNGDNCYIEYDGDTYEGKSDGLYVNGTKSKQDGGPVEEPPEGQGSGSTDPENPGSGTTIVTKTVERTEERTITRELTFTPEN